ncbi:MAG TPA: hypothetical protein VF173_22515 [Thermoanaerobaculia bacterium]|nr:hypothetical protein [Thermoanaerobaculia bacterium]
MSYAEHGASVRSAGVAWSWSVRALCGAAALRPKSFSGRRETLPNGDTAIVTFNVRSPDSVQRRTFAFRRGGGKWLISHFHASIFRLTPK